ncbi:oxidoreductase [Acrasis kona]|uniref:Oxidoreductase n=1 Tax=Acrasis kona TaxID=1008807 RepID=A0AAW2YVZ1_9EUKA
MSKQVYFITGANRGIGLEFVKHIIQRDNVFIYATTRDPTQQDELNAIAQANKNVKVLKLNSGSEEDAKAAAEEVKKHSDKIDVVIANAGYHAIDNTANATVSNLKNLFEINAIGPLVLFQALHDLLKKGDDPKIIFISSGAGSITMAAQVPFPILSYGASKAALNFIAQKVHVENEWLIATPIHPGLVDTRMSSNTEETDDFKKITTDTSVSSILKIVDNATRSETSGKFLNYDGTPLPW